MVQALAGRFGPKLGYATIDRSDQAKSKGSMMQKKYKQ
jgi:hypothetical protein